jgi:hypothetical protein
MKRRELEKVEKGGERSENGKVSDFIQTVGVSNYKVGESQPTLIRWENRVLILSHGKKKCYVFPKQHHFPTRHSQA